MEVAAIQVDDVDGVLASAVFCAGEKDDLAVVRRPDRILDFPIGAGELIGVGAVDVLDIDLDWAFTTLWICAIEYDYHSPHKFRRGYAIYSTALSKNSKDMKAISQNMMHSSIATTERYIDLPEKELREKILGLAGQELMTNDNLDSIVDQVADKVTEKLLREIGNLKQK